MIRKRLAFAVLTLTTLAAAFVAAPSARAHEDDYYGGGYSRGYDRGGYGGGYYDRGYNRGDDCYRPRRSYRPYSSGYYREYRARPVYRTYRTTSGSRYRCGCGERFASAYWLDYHQDHGRCGH